jgi:hypothetical protein|tara:strand:- start:310 stop:555 length:246 start_codon:yes stop_codon:yes gene_type:complete
MSRKMNMLMLTTLAMLADKHEGVNEPLDLEYAKQRQLERAKASKKDWMESQGINEYYYGENVICARNQKMADKKARKKGYL